MAKFTDTFKEGEVFICENCKKEFPAEKIKLQEAFDNPGVTSLTMSFIFVDKNGKIMGGNKPAEKESGDKLLACPYCDAIHLFGFNVKP